MIINTNKERGRAGLSLAIAYFGANGYTVSLPLNDSQWYDLIVEKDGIFQTVQCKFTSSKNRYIDLRSTGGTNGKVYDNAINHPLDLLFCADENQNLFVIPFKDFKDKVKYGVTLNTKPNSNGQGFATYKYFVKI